MASEPTVHVVEIRARDDPNHPVENSRRQNLVPRVPADLLVAAHDIESLRDLFKKTRDLSRVVLKIGVQGDYDITSSSMEPCAKSRRLSEIGTEVNYRQAVLSAGDQLVQDTT